VDREERYKIEEGSLRLRRINLRVLERELTRGAPDDKNLHPGNRRYFEYILKSENGIALGVVKRNSSRGLYFYEKGSNSRGKRISEKNELYEIADNSDKPYTIKRHKNNRALR
jgi:hypothetical protein